MTATVIAMNKLLLFFIPKWKVIWCLKDIVKVFRMLFSCISQESYMLFRILFSSEKKMPKSTKVYDCIFDVAICCLMENLCSRKFFSLCLKERDYKKNSFMITTHEDCFIGCCLYFLKISVKISWLEKLKLLLVSKYFYSGGFDSDDEDDEESLCINMDFDVQNINYFCFCCQKVILNSFSEELRYITCIDFF